MASQCGDLTDPQQLWLYCGSLGAAVAIAILFAIVTVTHLIQAIRNNKSFCWVIVMAASWEAAGYAFRAVSIQNPLQLGFYMPQLLFILLAPIWINAFVYMVFGRMVWYFLPEQKIAGIRATRMSLIFVLLDIFSFFVQSTGGSMASSPDASSIQLGLHIYMGGVALQQFFLLMFFCVTINFHRKVLRVENVRPTNWRTLLYVVYVVIALITVRIIYRLIEYSAGIDSYVPTHEWNSYVFDTVLMFTAILIFNIWHPGHFLVGVESDFPKKSRKQKKEEKRIRQATKKQQKEDKRAERSERNDEKRQLKAEKKGQGKQRNAFEKLPRNYSVIESV